VTKRARNHLKVVPSLSEVHYDESAPTDKLTHSVNLNPIERHTLDVERADAPMVGQDRAQERAGSAASVIMCDSSIKNGARAGCLQRDDLPAVLNADT
jgi:hypothetical protein